MTILLTINILAFLALLLLLSRLGRAQWSLSKKVLMGLLLGVIFGLSLQFIYPDNSALLAASVRWFNVVGNGYVKLLQMIIMPLVFVSILGAVARLHSGAYFGKMGSFVLAILLATTAIAALTGVFVTRLFHLTAEGLVHGAKEAARLHVIQDKYAGKVADFNLPDFLLSLVPKNPFAELTGISPTSIISVVIFATFLGIAALRLTKEDPEKGELLLKSIMILQSWIMKLVRLVMQVTPYGVMALITKMVVTTHLVDLLKLGSFILASYLGFIMMFGVHALLLGVNGLNPLRFFRKIWPVLSFAFTSRSSAASIPLSVETQVKRLGVPESVASFSASFGSIIGQNGCAGIYPAMLAVMMAPVMGINPLDPVWLATLVGIVTLSSVGVAGVGGGATFSALLVLPAMGLPVTLIALLISVEPLIDMGRTALNVSGSITAGSISSRWLGLTNMGMFNENDEKE